MTRRNLFASSLAAAVPACLLAAGLLADRTLHHASIAPPAEDVFADIEGACSGPEGVEDCAPRPFAERFAERLRVRDAGGATLERRWLADLAHGDHVAAYGLAWLRSRRSLPELRRRLLAERFFYGWETSTPDPPEVLFADDQFPHHQALIVAIEAIEGRPLTDVVELTADERRQLAREAAGCGAGRTAARWLLHKLDGAPLPSTKRNRARRLACDGPGWPGDP